MAKDSSSACDEQKLNYDTVICLSLNNLVQDELKSDSELSQEIKANIEENGNIPKVICFFKN